MLVDKRRQEKITRALAHALEGTGLKFQAAILLIQVEDESSTTGVTVMGSSTGDPGLVTSLCYQHLRRNLAEPITVTPYVPGEPDPNLTQPPRKGN
jgi:hypothetical protein